MSDSQRKGSRFRIHMDPLGKKLTPRMPKASSSIGFPLQLNLVESLYIRFSEKRLN